MRSVKVVGVMAAVLVALTACGGGGGGGNDDPTSTVVEDEVINPSNSNPSANRAPIADAGDLIQVNKGALIQFDGSRSNDPDGDELFYTWSIVRKPEGARPLTDKAKTAMPYMVWAAVGEYEIQLVVTDDIDDSDPSTVTVLVSDVEVAPVRPPVAVEALAIYDLVLIRLKDQLKLPDSYSLKSNIRYGQYGLTETGLIEFDFTANTSAGLPVEGVASCPTKWSQKFGYWTFSLDTNLRACSIEFDRSGAAAIEEPIVEEPVVEEPVVEEPVVEEDYIDQTKVRGVTFTLVNFFKKSYGSPAANMRVTNTRNSGGIKSVYCNLYALKGSTIVDTAFVYFASGGTIKKGESAIDDGIFFDLDGFDDFETTRQECDYSLPR